MLERLFPKQIDVTDRSNLIATLLLIPIVVLKMFMGFNATVMTRFVASTADGVPLDRYGAEGAQAVLAFFSLWGLEQELLALIALLALVRYRALIPLAYVILVVEHFGRKALFLVHPIGQAGGSTGASTVINWTLMAFLLVGLLFALFGKTARASTERRHGSPDLMRQ